MPVRALPEPKYTVSDVNHKYTILLPTGETVGPLKSVTTVLSVIDKPALKGWAARMSADYFKKEILRLGAKALNSEMLEAIAKDAAKAHTRMAKDAADIGSLCHDIFEATMLGRELPPIPADVQVAVSSAVDAFQNWRLQSDIEVVATELAVASLEHRAGGRLDYLGYSVERGGWGIGDYKTSSGFYGNEYAYQVGGGYALMVEEMYGIKIAWADITRFSKKAPYESEARAVSDLALAQEGFLNALRLTRSNELKLIGEPNFTSAGKPVEPAKAPAAPKTRKKVAGVTF